MSNDYLHGLREFELRQILSDLPSPSPTKGTPRVLDLGAGTGRQAAVLTGLGYDVVAIDLPSSAYASERVHPVVEYDGVRIPLDDNSVDVVFSSNVLEHVEHLDVLLAETRRVLDNGGVAIHILPTPAWRFWTTLAHLPWLCVRGLSLLTRGRKDPEQGGRVQESWEQERRGGLARRLVGSLWPERHGERGNTLTETWYFSERWWRRTFVAARFDVRNTRPAGIFYTGAMLLAGRLALGHRRKFASVLGSSCRIYVLTLDPARPEASDSHGFRKQTY